LCGQREINKRLQRDMNPGTLKLLESKGCNLSTTITILNVFYLNRAGVINEFIELLKNHNFHISKEMVSSSSNDPSVLCLKAEILLLPTCENINNMTDTCIDIAEQVGADYDGWYTEI